MIQLEFMQRSKDERQKVVEDYCGKLLDGCNPIKLSALNQWCSRNLNVKDFQDIVKAEFPQLKKWSSLIKNKKISIGLKKYLINTLYKTRHDHYSFVKSLGVTVCPYCNRNFVNSGKMIKCHLDHFFPKDIYPLYSISFYNLIPVCPTCNTVKGTKAVSYSPYDISMPQDELLNFDFRIKGLNFLHKKGDLEILIHPSRKLSKNIKVLDLRNIYQVHSDFVQELLYKKSIYLDWYIDKIWNLMFQDEETRRIKERILIGGYVSPEEYGKRPLSKFMSDIGRHLGMIS